MEQTECSETFYIYLLYADVPEHSVCSIFIGKYLPMKMEQTEFCETFYIYLLYADVSEHSVCSIFICKYLPMKMEQTEFSETSSYKIQTPGNYPEENIQRLVSFTFR